MNLDDPKGIIELGDLSVSCLIYRIKDNNIEILSTYTTPCEGIHNDVVTNVKKATSAIRSCISSAEKIAKISLKKINVIFEQPDFLCTKFTKQKKIDGAKIQRDDIEFMIIEGKKELNHNDKNQYLIHIFNHNYVVDNKIFIEEPIGIYADSLSHEITFITTLKNNIKNINQILNSCDLGIERFISRTFAQGAEFFNDKDLESGSILINLGFESTSLGVFKNLALINSITLPIGINHITKDISKVCSLDLKESELIRNEIDFSFQKNENLFNKSGYLKESYFINSNYRKISEKLILGVVKARIDEIFNSLKKQLKLSEINLSLGIPFLLLGMGSHLYNLEVYSSSFFDLNCYKINKNKKKNMLDVKFSSFSGAIKIIKNGWETEAIPVEKGSNIEKKGFFAKIFGNS